MPFSTAKSVAAPDKRSAASPASIDPPPIWLSVEVMADAPLYGIAIFTIPYIVAGTAMPRTLLITFSIGLSFAASTDCEYSIATKWKRTYLMECFFATLLLMGIDERRIKLLQENLEVIRKIAGWTGQRMAEEIGVTRQTIGNLEKGRQKMSKTQYLALRSVLNFEIANSKNGELAIIIRVLVDEPAEAAEHDCERGKSEQRFKQTAMSDLSSTTTAWADPKKIAAVAATAAAAGSFGLAAPVVAIATAKLLRSFK